MRRRGTLYDTSFDVVNFFIERLQKKLRQKKILEGSFAYKKLFALSTQKYFNNILKKQKRENAVFITIRVGIFFF